MTRWTDRAACKGTPVAVFYPDTEIGGDEHEHRGRTPAAEYEVAATLCASCPVTSECLAEVMREEGYGRVTLRCGWRAGLAPWERRRIVACDACERPVTPAQQQRTGGLCAACDAATPKVVTCPACAGPLHLAAQEPATATLAVAHYECDGECRSSWTLTATFSRSEAAA